MRCGLFGKLLAKRDFVSVAAPRHFLRLWEPWIGTCLTHSRTELGDPDWGDVFVEAPIWRFFLGADLCGSSFVGAFMPSVDAVGRYFPLTLVAQADPGMTLATPEVEFYQSWFEAGEDLLLSALDADLTRDAVDAKLKSLRDFRNGSCAKEHTGCGRKLLVDARRRKLSPASLSGKIHAASIVFYRDADGMVFRSAARTITIRMIER
jgi:type VI secretion system ImpM family protein